MNIAPTYECEDCGDTMQPGLAALDHPDVLEQWSCLKCGGDMVKQ